MKKKILFHSNSAKAFTGFGKNAKNILKYLFKTNKYEVIEFANNKYWGDASVKMRPWKAQGSLPNNPQYLNQIKSDAQKYRQAGYGALTIDKAIEEYKPDVYLGAEDIWAFESFWKKPWWKKINTMIWTTLDSQPILPQAIEAASETENFYAWASFAERDLKKLGHDHVGTLHGSVDTKDFYRLSDSQRREVRNKFGLKDEFIIGFVFRNQLRKSVPNMLDGFKSFKKECPKAKLLLHTHWKEGWDIPALIKEKNINHEDVLTTYFCSACEEYEIQPFKGQEQECPHCKEEKSLSTTNTQAGVNERQLNEIYNLMDVYCHPFTSGGMEIPIFEAKLTELVTLVTNYSCGEDSSSQACGSFPLDWAEYREPGTQFIKASTYSSSIAKQLKKVWKMGESKRLQMGRVGREWTIKNYSIEAIGKKLENILDAMPNIDYNFPLKSSDEEKSEDQKIDFCSLLDEGQRLALLITGQIENILLVNSLISNLAKLHPNHDIYVITELKFADYIEDHPDVYKVLQYSSEIDDINLLEEDREGGPLFDMAFSPCSEVQRNSQIFREQKNKTQFDLYDYKG